MKIGLIFGTRPEAIKMGSLYHTLKNSDIDVKVISTGQHKEMLYQVLNLFEIRPDYELNIMKEGQDLVELTSKLISKVGAVIKNEKFDFILVQGDTTSAFVGALVGFYNKIPVGHIEAGLRTGDIYSPFPEEINRKLIGSIAEFHFAPTEINVNNLLKEGINKEKIFKVGNTVIDSLYWVKENKSLDLQKIRDKYNLRDKKYILMTMHRRENWGEPMRNALKGVRKYLEENDVFYLVFPMHFNPIVRKVIKEELKGLERKILVEALEYLEFIGIMDGAHFIMTDSGGVQEEAPSLGKPTLVLRNTTERPEAIEAGTAKLIGTSSSEVYKNMKLLEGELFEKMSKASNPYGDGTTSLKIKEIIQRRKK
ncbi:non-hydrolyzing UDP-N-acetylglucosamine 2-epimerase [Cetobacterium sp.]